VIDLTTAGHTSRLTLFDRQLAATYQQQQEVIQQATQEIVSPGSEAIQKQQRQAAYTWHLTPKAAAHQCINLSIPANVNLLARDLAIEHRREL
jgi:hypothetical protein